MLGWLRRNPRKSRRLAARVLEGMREVGLLLVTFAPLEVVLNRAGAPGTASRLLIFLGIGAFLFSASLTLEWMFSNDE